MRKKVFTFFWKGLLLGVFLLILFFASIYYGVFGHLYSKDELLNFKNESASLVYSEDGELIGKFFARNRTNITYDQFPQNLIQALLATEDARFFEHGAVDSRSMFRVLIKSLLLQKKSSGGGSTLTQQLAKNMYGRKSFGPLTLPVNKTKEIILANRLEEIFSKEDILTLYLNTVPFGENVYGAEAAARRYFNKGAKDLKAEESAVLVGILKANTYYNPRINPSHALKRRNLVLSQMGKYGYLTEAAVDSLKNLPLQLNYTNLAAEGIANYFLVRVKKQVSEILKRIEKTEGVKYDMYKDGLIIETTLNAQLQNYALQAYRSHLKKMQILLRKEYKKQHYRKELDKHVARIIKKEGLEKIADVRKKREYFTWEGYKTDSISVRDSLRIDLTYLHAGFLAMQPENGAVKAWVGGIDYRTHPYDQVLALRQVASTFKPVLYATAMEEGITPCHYLENDSIVLTDYDNWTPKNYDNKYGGRYSVAAALAYSKNIPTVNLFLQTPFTSLEKKWKALGFTQPLINKPSVALGTENASIYELAVTYSAFANGGVKIEPYMVKSIKTPKGEVIYSHTKKQEEEAVLSEKTVYWINAILQKAVNEGTGRALRSVYGLKLPLAGKTGTSQDYADAWFAGYNPSVVMVTRVGAALPSVHFHTGANGSGSRLALPLVGKTFQQVQRDKKLRYQFGKDFPPLPDELAADMQCEDFIEDSKIEEFFERIFSKNKTTSEKASKRARKKTKKKGSFFKRLFGKDK